MGKTKTKVGIKEKAPVHVKSKKPTFKPPKRIRMLRSCANQDMAYIKGHVYDVPRQVSVDTARRWIRSRTADVWNIIKK